MSIVVHFHFDHAFGNPLLAEDGTWIITHTNARRSMAGEHRIDLVGMTDKQEIRETDLSHQYRHTGVFGLLSRADHIGLVPHHNV